MCAPDGAYNTYLDKGKSFQNSFHLSLLKKLYILLFKFDGMS